MNRGLRIFLWTVVFFSMTFQLAAAPQKWKELKSRHFIVYYKDTPEGFARTVLDSAEEDFQQISSDLGFVRYQGWEFDNRAQIYIFNDKEDYIESSRQADWSAGIAYHNQRIIKTYPSAAGFFDSLLPHELGHIIFYEFIGNQHADIPRWFDEGVAMYQEKAQRWGSHQIVKKALREETFIPLEQLSQTLLRQDSSKEFVELFYAESASVVYFLIKEHGDFRFLNFCRQLRDGNPFDRALALSYPHFRTLKQFNEAWVFYLERQ